MLVVEDDPQVRRAITRWLALAGFEPIPVADAIEAVGLLSATDDVVCVVSDLTMPRLDGDALRAKLAEVRAGTPLVLISGDRAPSTPPADGVRFVAKPLTRDALIEAIAAVTTASIRAA